MHLSEQTGEKFNLGIYLAARETCRDVVRRIAARVEPGMSERDGQILIRDEFAKVGVSKFWHPSKFRIGTDTMKTFRAPPDESLKLEEGELFFIDVGPIIDDHEADYGETFLLLSPLSEKHRALAEVPVKVWEETARLWREQNLTGRDLYERASESAHRWGLRLNPLMAGHRLGDFPHALFSKDSLSSFALSPKDHLWVLEIHLISDELQRGAFYEDILMS